MAGKTKAGRPAWRLVVLGLAVLAFAAVWLIRPGVGQYRLWQARRALDQRDATLALEWLAQAEQIAPGYSTTEFLRARAYRRLGQPDQVRTHLLRARELGHPVEALQREATLTEAQTGQLNPGDAELQALLANPRGDTLEIYEAVVQGYLRMFQPGPASLLLDAWQADFPQDSQPLYYRGLIAIRLDHLEEAEAAFRSALRLCPERDDVRLLLADALRENFEYHAALEHYRRGLDNDPDNPQAWFGVAKCLDVLGETREARDAYLRLLEREPDHYEGLLGIGNLDLAYGNAAEAVRWLEAAAAQRPWEFEVRHALAWALQVAGQRDRAREHFEYAVKAQEIRQRLVGLTRRAAAEPGNADLRYRVGAILLERGQTADASTWLTSALRLEPDHPEARRAQLRLRASFDRNSADVSDPHGKP
jgi:tetratricopeptide (TPR) repeat protein